MFYSNGENMSQIASKLESNIKARVTSVAKITDNMATMSRDAMSHLKNLEPGQAVFTLTEEGLKGASRFLKDQCEITRRWIK